MAKKIIKVEEKKKTNKSSLDLGKIKDVIKNNPQAVKKITEGIGELITNNTKNKTASKKTTKKNSKKTSSSNASGTIETLSKLFK